MGKHKDLTDQTIGDLKVLKRVETPSEETATVRKYAWWRCRCCCGNEITVSSKYLTNKVTTHCGCKAAEKRRNRGRRPRDAPAGKSVKPRPFSGVGQNGNVVTRPGITVETMCQHCKKVFERRNGPWGYKNYTGYYCTYRCMRAAERAAEEAKKK